MTTIQIRFSVVVNGTYLIGAWVGASAKAIAAGAAALDAEEVDGVYVYHADETGEDYAHSADEVAALGAALLAGHTFGEAYSIWCAESMGVELPPAEDEDEDEDAEID